jgi:hypothetical protein
MQGYIGCCHQLILTLKVLITKRIFKLYGSQAPEIRLQSQMAAGPIEVQKISVERETSTKEEQLANLCNQRFVQIGSEMAISRQLSSRAA